jgi:trehalose synthase
MVRRAWSFLRPYVSAARVVIFSRRTYVWDGLEPAQVEIISPSIDAFTTKNREMDGATVSSILQASGLLESGSTSAATAAFVRADGSTGHLSRRAEVLEEAPLQDGDQLVLQVSRWDRLKDPVGVLNGFVQHVEASGGAHLVLAGPSISGVADDPEQPEIMRELQHHWDELDPATRARVHIAQLPMEDADENATLVNALQRRADVVVQKSIAEGFGLTVAEAMWKGRAVVASRVGGIEDQIEDGKSGLLIDDPVDLAAFGQAVSGLLRDPDARRALGSEARRRVGRKFLAPRELIEHANLLRRVTAHAGV